MSFITLIPKKDETCSMNDYPISLIGGVYKIFSKVLANTLSSVMDLIILKNQTAFVRTRQIQDEIVILIKAIDEAKRRKLSKVFFKINFAKCYDSIEWDFLDLMMERFNFYLTWRKWILECVFLH